MVESYMEEHGGIISKTLHAHYLRIQPPRHTGGVKTASRCRQIGSQTSLDGQICVCLHNGNVYKICSIQARETNLVSNKSYESQQSHNNNIKSI